MIGSRSYSMFGLLGPIDDIQASIQGKVAEFLGCRTRLNEMTKSPILTISDKSQELTINQSVLENELQLALETIDKVKNDVYSMSDIASVISFYPSMIGHIDDVDELWNEYSGLGESAKPPTNWLMYGAVVLAGYWFLIGRKKRRG